MQPILGREHEFLMTPGVFRNAAGCVKIVESLRKSSVTASFLKVDFRME